MCEQNFELVHVESELSQHWWLANPGAPWTSSLSGTLMWRLKYEKGCHPAEEYEFVDTSGCCHQLCRSLIYNPKPWFFLHQTWLFRVNLGSMQVPTGRLQFLWWLGCRSTDYSSEKSFFFLMIAGQVWLTWALLTRRTRSYPNSYSLINLLQLHKNLWHWLNWRFCVGTYLCRSTLCKWLVKPA